MRKIYKKLLNKKLPAHSKDISIAIIILLLLLCIGSFIFYKYLASQIRSDVTTITPLTSDNNKQLTKQTVKTVSSATFRIPILMYHYVEYVQDKKDKIRQSLNITPYTFEQQIKTLQNAGFTFMTAKELGDAIDGTTQLPKKPILLTFDDGHWDFDKVVLPILKKYHIKATVYIITGFIGKSDFMTQNQLQDVVSSGLIDVGAHSIHHAMLKGKFFPVVAYEVYQSKAMLENTYHISVASFAYPDGVFDQQAINIVKGSGFTTAVSTIPGIEQSNKNRFFLYRLRPGYKTGETLLEYLRQNVFKAY